MDAKKKSIFRFNIIDIIIIVAVLAVACAFVFRTPSNIANTNAGEFSAIKVSAIKYDKTIEYTLKIGSVQEASANLVKIGDYIYSHITEGPIGKVTGVRHNPAELYVSLPTGEIVKRQTPNRVDIYITVTAPAYVDKTGHYLEGYLFVCANKELYCYTQKLDFIGVVESVKDKRENVVSEEPPAIEPDTDENESYESETEDEEIKNQV